MLAKPFASAVVVTVCVTMVHAAPMPPRLPAIGAATSPLGFAQACADFAWLCSRPAPRMVRRMSDEWLLRTAESINSGVNRSVMPRPVSEMRWALASSTGGGDCISYSLMKLQRLLAAGVSPDAVFLANVLTEAGESHAVVIVRLATGDYVLDNLRDEILLWSATRHTVLKVQNPVQRAHWDLVLLGPRARRS